MLLQKSDIKPMSTAMPKPASRNILSSIESICSEEIKLTMTKRKVDLETPDVSTAKKKCPMSPKHNKVLPGYHQ